MNHCRIEPWLVFCIGVALCVTDAGRGWSAPPLEPADPFAAIDGQPIYLGELNLVLSERFSIQDHQQMPPEVQQATAAVLVRRHLAMRSLRQIGGDALQALIRRQQESYVTQLQRRGSSVDQQAKLRGADENSLMADLAWRTAWGQYLKSQLTDANLKRFFDQHPHRYGGGRWRVSQIFVEMDTRDAQSVAAARERMQQLAAEIRSSGQLEQAFSEAARMHSDAASAGEGGTVGWVSKDGDLPAAVMQIVRTTPAGQISDPIRSPLGMHVVLVHESQQTPISFADLTDHSQLRRDAVDALFEKLVQQQSEAEVSWLIPALKPTTEP